VRADGWCLLRAVIHSQRSPSAASRERECGSELREAPRRPRRVRPLWLLWSSWATLVVEVEQERGVGEGEALARVAAALLAACHIGALALRGGRVARGRDFSQRCTLRRVALRLERSRLQRRGRVALRRLSGGLERRGRMVPGGGALHRLLEVGLALRGKRRHAR